MPFSGGHPCFTRDGDYSPGRQKRSVDEAGHARVGRNPDRAEKIPLDVAFRWVRRVAWIAYLVIIARSTQARL